jgi:hypothetical protein
VERPQRRLDREREHEPEEEPALDVDWDIQGDEIGEQERRLPRIDRLHVQSDHRGEHDQPTEQVVEQELHCGVPPLRAAIEADEEVHRHQHRLE